MNKNTIVLIFLCIAIKGFGQPAGSTNTFTFNGQLPDSKLDSVSIEYVNSQGKFIQQAVAAVNGNFSFSGLINQPGFAYLLLKHKDEVISKRDKELKRVGVYLEPGVMTMEAEPDPKGYAYIKGSKSQVEWNELKSKTRSLQSAIDSLSRLNGNDRTKQSFYRSQLANINYGYFIDHPNSYVTADQVRYYTSAFSLDSLKQLYSNFTTEIKESLGGKRLAAEIRSRGLGLPGTMAYSFTVKDREGKELSLNQFKGKYVLLDFWATWCIPCRNSMPHMISVFKKYKDNNFDIIAIGDDDKNLPNWSAAIDHDSTGIFHQTLRGLDMEMALKAITNPRDLSEQYGIHALPTKILIDPSGKIIGRFTGPDIELDQMLATIFK